MIDQSIQSETIRYLGVADAVPDRELTALIERAIDRVNKAAHKQYTVMRVTCCVKTDGVWLDTHFVKSEQLAKHLAGCTTAFLFAATLGAGVDRLLRRDTIAQPSMAVAEQAAAAAIMEQYSDAVCSRLEEELRDAEGDKHLLGRFSPGYGDMPLEEQVFLLESLQAGKRIGLSCTDRFMLTPAKSITAVIGVAEGTSRCYANGCAMCAKTDCVFRKK